MSRCFVPLLLAALWSATPAAAQWRLPIVLETRGGYAIPRGEFGRGEAGARPHAGPRFAVGGHVVLTPLIAVYGSYHQNRFGCDNCSALDMDDSMVSRAGEAGIEVRPLPAGPFGVLPWLRGGAVYQTLGFSADDERMTSRGAVGYSLGGGLAVPMFGPLELRPGIGFTVVHADFEFTTGPARSLEVRSLLVELGAAFRLGGRR